MRQFRSLMNSCAWRWFFASREPGGSGAPRRYLPVRRPLASGKYGRIPNPRASAIGMSASLRFRRIIMPQVLRFAIPGLGNVWQLSLKDSALISVTGLAELMRTSQVAAGSTRQYFLFFIAGGCLYLILTSLSDQVFNRAERRANRSMPSAAMGKA